MDLTRGTILKLSQEGMRAIYGYSRDDIRERAKLYRFTFLGYKQESHAVLLRVKKVGSRLNYLTFHPTSWNLR